MTDPYPDVQALLDESYESDLTEEESEELLLLCGHGIGPKLSPAAQEVRKAYYSTDDDLAGPALAAALRAAAEQVAPFPGRYPMNEYMEGFREAKQSVHHQLLAIAAELEAQ